MRRCRSTPPFTRVFVPPSAPYRCTGCRRSHRRRTSPSLRPPARSTTPCGPHGTGGIPPPPVQQSSRTLPPWTATDHATTSDRLLHSTSRCSPDTPPLGAASEEAAPDAFTQPFHAFLPKGSCTPLLQAAIAHRKALEGSPDGTIGPSGWCGRYRSPAPHPPHLRYEAGRLKS